MCQRFRQLRLVSAGTMLAVLLVSFASRPAAADVIVLANRIERPMPIRLVPASGAAQELTITSGDVVPLFVDGKAHVEFASGNAVKRYLLDANCAYYFGRDRSGRLDLQKIGLGEDGTALDGRHLPGDAVGPDATITVKICVDDEEPARRNYWERRLRRRIEAASAIFEKFCGVKLEVVATGTWNSENSANDLEQSLAEFEHEVSPAPARVAIGFTSQYQFVRGRVHMAGTRGPLSTHILAQEGSPQISEPEKLEFLVHELGHFLGAAHSPERRSVMRPVLGDNLAGRSDYKIQFDPVNALAVAMVGEEVRRRHIKVFSDLAPETKRRLKQIYTQLASAMPDDPAGAHFARMVGSEANTPLSTAAKTVLQAIVEAASANRALPLAPDKGPGGVSRRMGDQLTEYYVREAARAADKLPRDIAPRALLLALAVGIDDSQMLLSVPGITTQVSAVETPTARSVRLTLLGEPTLRGRRDLAQHFFISAYLTSTMGEATAEAAGFAKELFDAQGTSGFSFADIAADRAGSRFARGVLKNHFPLAYLGKSFEGATFVPPIEKLPEGLSLAQFKTNYQTNDGPQVVKLLQEIDNRINTLPPYRPSTLKLSP